MNRTKAPAPIAAPVSTVATELAQRIAALGLTVSVEQFRTLLDEFHNLADELRIPMEAAYDGAEMFWATPYPPASSVCGMYNSYRDAIAAVAEAMEGNAFGLREIAPEEGHAMAYMVTIEAGPSSWVIYQPNKVSYWIIREDEAYSSPYVGSDGMNLEENENGRRVYFDKVGDAMAYHGDPLAGSPVSCAPDPQPLALVCQHTEQATTDTDGSSGFNATLTGQPRTWSAWPPSTKVLR